MRAPFHLAALIASSSILALGVPKISVLAVREAIAQERITQSTESSTALRHEGLRLAYAGQLFTALERMERALVLARSNDDQAEEADTLAAIADIQVYLDKKRTATDTAQQALALYKSLDNLAGESAALRVLAASQYEIEPLETAIATAEQSLEVAEASGSLVQQGLITSDLGAYFVLAQEYEEGLAYLEKALPLLAAEALTIEEQLRSDYVRSFTVLWIANAQVKLDAEKVMSTLDEAIALGQSTHNPHAEGAALYVKGLWLAEKGELDKALSSYQQAAAVLAKTDYRQILTDALLATSQNKVFLYVEEGRFEAAVVAQKDAIEAFKSKLSYSVESGDEYAILKDKVQLSLAYSMLSQVHEALGQYEAGVTTAKLALETVEGTSARGRILGSIYILVGHYYYLNNRSLVAQNYAEVLEYSEQALDYAQRALALAEQDVQVAGRDFPGGTPILGMVDSEEKRQAAIEQVLSQTKLIYSQIGFAASEQDDHQKTIEYAHKTLEIEERLGDREGAFQALAAIGQSYTLLGQYDKALLAAQQAEAIAQDLNNPRYLLRARRNTAHIYDRWGKYPTAIETYQIALTLAKQQDNKINEILILGNLGVLGTAQGQYQLALEEFETSLKTVRSLRKQVTDAGNLDELSALCSTGSQSQDNPQAALADDEKSAFGEAISNSSLKSQRHTCLSMMWNFEGTILVNTASIYGKQGRYQDALEYYAQALDIVREWSGPSDQGDVLSNIGVTHYDAGNYKEALHFAQQALSVRKQVDEPTSIANSLNNLSAIYQEQGEYRKALSAAEEALEILQESEYKPLEALILNNISIVYREQGRYAEAESLLQEAISIEQVLDLLPHRASSLTNLSSLESDQGNYPAALGYLEESLQTYREIGAKPLEGITLTFIGRIHERQGNYSKAFALHEEALAIARSLEDKDDEAEALSAIGRTYDKLGQYAQAKSAYQDALVIFKNNGDVTGESSVLSQLGENASRQTFYSEALAFYEEALQLQQKAGSAIRESQSLLNLGLVQLNLDDLPSAEDALERSLNIQERIGVQRDKADTLAGLARIEREKGNFDEASSLLQKSLLLHRELGDIDGESATLAQIGELFSQRNQPELAILFYKQSINIIEDIRSDLSGLPPEFQRSFAGTITNTYRKLADLLIQQDRIFEAQKVLDLLKVQELEDYLGSVRGNATTKNGIDYNKPEQEILDLYEERESAIALDQELTELDEKDSLTSEEEIRRNQLTKIVDELALLFNDFFMNDEEVQALVAQLEKVEGRTHVELSSIDRQRDKLSEQDAALLYPLILDNRIELVLATGEANPLRRTVENVTKEELNQAILDFQQALRDPNSDAIAPAQKLYKWLVEPIKDDLAAADVETILYSPDGVLRYVPLAALHDGNQWVAERFLINNITSESLEAIGNQPASEAEPRIFAGAFADSSKVYSVGNSSYRGLPFAGQEVELLAKTVPSVAPFFDNNFSLETVKSEIRRSDILHFATHASFVSSEPSESFILFGDGSVQTVKHILEEWNISNIDLVVLSACETGLGDIDREGKQILGLGYQFQTRGADAVIASLWQVNDGSTQILMNDFYKYLGQGMHKNESIQKAQLAMIKSGLTVAEAMKRSGLEALDAETGKPAIASVGKINHPHYWAPFILIGNGL